MFMSAKLLLEYVNVSDLLICVGLLFLLHRRKLIQDFRVLTTYVALRAVTEMVCIPILFFRKEIGLTKSLAYDIFFYSYWPSFILQFVLMVVIVYSVYSVALRPFAPLRDLGKIMFRWVAAISVAVSVGVAMGPHMFGHIYALNLVTQIQQTASVLTLCLLLFVTLALRPLGLSARSQSFGACLGLGVLATMQLVQSAWFSSSEAQSLYSPVYIYSGLAACAGLMIWGIYFAMPIPKNRMVLLPTTSPYFFWNKISEALGDAPGYVVVDGFTPDSLAPGELDGLLAASDAPYKPAPTMLQPIAVNR